MLIAVPRNGNCKEKKGKRYETAEIFFMQGGRV